MSRILITTFAMLLFAVATPAVAGAPAAPNWMFERSYYSHEPVHPVRINRRSAGIGPYYSRPTVGYVRAGFRNNRSTIQIGGMTYDHVQVFESWVQTGAQY